MDALLERMPWLYAGLVLLVAVNPSGRHRLLGCAGLGLALLATASNAVAGPGGDPGFVTTNEVLFGAGAVIVVLALVLGSRGSRERQIGETPDPLIPGSPDSLTARFPDPLLLSGLVLASAGPHLLVVELGIALAVLHGVRVTLRSRRLLWLLPLAAGTVLIGVACFLLLAILGAQGGPMVLLPEGPFSPAAERLLVMLLGAGSLLLAGLPPLHRAPWGLDLAPLGAIVLVRIGLAALPGGVLDWHTLALLLLALSICGVGAMRRWPALSVAAGLIGLWSGVPAGALAAQVLVLWGWLMEQGRAGRLGRLPRLPARWRGLLLVVPGLAARPALQAALGAEVVISVLALSCALVAAFAGFVRRSRVTPSPLY